MAAVVVSTFTSLAATAVGRCFLVLMGIRLVLSR
jgi:hypothetical protein